MTADLGQLRRCWQLWTGRTVAGEGIAARVENQRIAGHQLANAMPALLDELEQLRGVIEKVRSHSRPVRYVVEWAEGKRDDAGKRIAEKTEADRGRG